MAGSATIVLPPYKNLQWTRQAYETNAPAPFGKVVFGISVDSNQQVVAIDIAINGINLNVDKEIYKGLSAPNKVEIVYSDPARMESKSVEYIEFYFEVGESYLVDWGDDAPECKPPCSNRAKDIVVIRVDSRMTIQHKISSMREFHGSGT